MKLFDLVIAHFHWLIMRKTEKEDNSIMDFENIRSSIP